MCCAENAICCTYYIMKGSPEALRSPNLFDSGYGYVVVSRFKTDGRVESGFFLLDMYCLGVKDAGFHCFSSIADYRKNLLEGLFTDVLATETPLSFRKARGAQF